MNSIQTAVILKLFEAPDAVWVLEKVRLELVHLGGIRFGLRGNVAWFLIPPLLARINAEENLLRAQFGEDYKAYCSHRSRLIPGIY
jgi:hypothetical protein